MQILERSLATYEAKIDLCRFCDKFSMRNCKMDEICGRFCRFLTIPCAMSLSMNIAAVVYCIICPDAMSHCKCDIKIIQIRLEFLYEENLFLLWIPERRHIINSITFVENKRFQ